MISPHTKPNQAGIQDTDTLETSKKSPGDQTPPGDSDPTTLNAAPLLGSLNPQRHTVAVDQTQASPGGDTGGVAGGVATGGGHTGGGGGVTHEVFLELPFLELPFLELPFLELPFLELFLEPPQPPATCSSSPPVNSRICILLTSKGPHIAARSNTFCRKNPQQMYQSVYQGCELHN
jgi:hypothetical protein